MTKTIDTLVADIQHILTSKDVDARNLDSVAVTEFAGRIIEHLDNAVGDEVKERKPGTIYASELGKKCLRETVLKHNTPSAERSPLDGPTALKFFYGNLLEEVVLELAQAAGHDVTAQQKSYKHKINSGHQVSGRSDCIIDNCMVDVKTASQWAFDKYSKEGINLDNDTYGYIAQLEYYYTKENQERYESGKPPLSDTGYFLFICKSTGRMQLVKHNCIDAGFCTLNRAAEVSSALTAYDVWETLPKIPFTLPKPNVAGNVPMPKECRYCDFKKNCWPTLRKFQYSNGPQYLVVVNKEPRVPEVEDFEV